MPSKIQDLFLRLAAKCLRTLFEKQRIIQVSWLRLPLSLPCHRFPVSRWEERKPAWLAASVACLLPSLMSKTISGLMLWDSVPALQAGDAEKAMRQATEMA